jgi:hypothetical protein
MHAIIDKRFYLGPKVLVLLGDDMELGMTSYLNSNFGRILNRVPS